MPHHIKAAKEYEYHIDRIEGHIIVQIFLDEKGNVIEAYAMTPEFRGFEKFVIGRHISKVPYFVSRICGVCPTAHHTCAAKAIDFGLGSDIPTAGWMLRELQHQAAYIHDFPVHIFVLAGPDILLEDLPEPKRGLVPLIQRYPDVVKQVIWVRNIGQRFVSKLGIQASHPMGNVIGGFRAPLSKDDRDKMLALAKECLKVVLDWYDKIIVPIFEKYAAEKYPGLGRQEVCSVGLVNGDNLELFDGKGRILLPDGSVLVDMEQNVDVYYKYMAEMVEPWGYAKHCYVKPLGPGKGDYRVGPLARVNVAKDATTEHAKRMLKEFKNKYGVHVHDPLFYNVARYICGVHAIERCIELLEDDRILSSNVRADVKIKAGEGIAFVEAPRGFLVHHYAWDDNGIVTKANIIVPTTCNSHIFTRMVRQIAQQHIKNGEIDNPEKMWHEICACIRAHDPCISCATHGEGWKDITVKIYNHEGKLIKVLG